MPYDTDESVPSHVPKVKRAQWRAIWNKVYNECGGGKACEESAFKQANGAALSEHISHLFSEVPSGTPKLPSELVVYIELPGAKKDAQCLLVDIPGGISMQHGCCDIWDRIAGESPASFQCGTCLYHQHAGHSTHMGEAVKPLPPRLFACDLVTLGEVVDAAKGVYKIPMAYTGTFHKDGEKFSITRTDLFTIVKNFRKKQNGTVNVDYEHASEIPELAKGGPVPASGWIQDVMVEADENGEPVLMGMVEWTPIAKNLIETKQYRFFSPAIDWSATDKETGDPQGATLTSSALTNRPFLEKLPPLLMTEVPRLYTEETTMPDEKKSALVLTGTPEEIKVLTEAVKGKGGKLLILGEGGGSLRLRKVMDATGTHIHVHAPGTGKGEEAFGELMGEIVPEDFASLTAVPAESSSSTPGEPDEATMGAALGETGAVSMSDVKRFYVAGKEAVRMQDASTGHKLLSETLTKDGWDKRKARTLLSDGKVSPQQYAAFENAIELVEKGVEEGKIHPTQRNYFLADAINRPAEFEKMLSESKPYVDLTEHGLAGTNDRGRVAASEHERVETEVRQYMKDNKCSYTKALRAITGDPKRGQRMRDEAHGAKVM